MFVTETPFEQYFDTDGDPLDEGYVYFGLPNQNPETAPIAIFWDLAGTIPAAQPIRTLNGYTVRNGTPANVYTASNYSVTVRNKKRKLVYYAPDATTFSNLFFIQAGTGALPIPVLDKLRQLPISLLDYTGGAISPTDNTAALQAAVTYAASIGRAVSIPQGDVKILGTLTSTGVIRLIANGADARLVGNGQPLVNSCAGIDMQGVKFTAFGDLITLTGNASIAQFRFARCSVTAGLSLLNWIDAARDKRISNMEVSDCTISGLTNFVCFCEPAIDYLMFARNKIDACSRYVLRSLHGSAPETYGKNLHIHENVISNITNGAFTGSAGVARVFQIAANGLWIEGNHFENVTTTVGATGNSNILYGDIDELWVVDNDHFDCGNVSGDDFLYHDKAPNNRSRNHTYRGNTYVQSDASTISYGMMHSIARNVSVTENKFTKVRGLCFYAGFNSVKNVVYSHNEHLDLRGIMAVQLHGEIENLVHEGNVYDGITNDLSAIDSGVRGAWFVKVQQSSGTTGPSNVRSLGNIYRRVAPVDVTPGRVAACFVVAMAGSTADFLDFSWRSDDFSDSEDGLHFRGSTHVIDRATIENCGFMPSVTNPIRLASGAPGKPINYIVRNNRGYVTENFGQATIANGASTVAIAHGLTSVPSGSVVNVQMLGDGNETIWWSTKTTTSVTANRASNVGDRLVDWYASYKP